MISSPIPSKIDSNAALGIAWIIGVFTFFLDLATKYLTQAYLPLSSLYGYRYPYGGIGLFENFLGIEFSLNHTTNRGAAWGILADYQAYLLVLRILFVACLTVYLVYFNKDKNKQIPFMLIMAGALGNICDYFFYGEVIDMFHFVFWGYDYPVFNLADSAIFIGIGWLFILSFQKPLNRSNENR